MADILYIDSGSGILRVDSLDPFRTTNLGRIDGEAGGIAFKDNYIYQSDGGPNSNQNIQPAIRRRQLDFTKATENVTRLSGIRGIGGMTTRDDHFLIVERWTGDIYQWDGTSSTLTSVVDVTLTGGIQQVHSILYVNDTTYIGVIHNSTARGVWEVDLNDGSLEKVVNMSNEPLGLAFANGNTYAMDHNELFQIDTSNGIVRRIVDFGGNGRGMTSTYEGTEPEPPPPPPPTVPTVPVGPTGPSRRLQRTREIIEIDWGDNQYRHKEADVSVNLIDLFVRYGLDTTLGDDLPFVTASGDMTLSDEDGKFNSEGDKAFDPVALRKPHKVRIRSARSGLA